MKLNRFVQTTHQDAADDEFYNYQQVRELIENDELTVGEEGFMSGYLRAQ